MKVKICGITNLDDALAAVDAGADALGFVFAQEGRAKNRYIDPANFIAEIQDQIPPFIITVGVVIDPTDDQVDFYLELVDRIQLHGDEHPEWVVAIGPRTIKALRMGPDFTPKHANRYIAGAILLDAHDAEARGGTGRTVDWDMARKVVEQVDTPIILAGGLTPENVAEAVRIVRPYAVDVSGGVEKEPGKKDHDKLRRFVREAKLSLP